MYDYYPRGNSIQLRIWHINHHFYNTRLNMLQSTDHTTNHHNWTYQCMPMTMSSMQDCCCDSMYVILNVYVNRRLLFLYRYHCHHMTHLYTMHMMNQIDNTPHHSTMGNCFPLRTCLMVLNNWYNMNSRVYLYRQYMNCTNYYTISGRTHSIQYDTMNSM